jgi:hypothetical protein
MLYKPFSVQNPTSKEHIGTEDEMAIDYPFKETKSKDGSFMKHSSDLSY